LNKRLFYLLNLTWGIAMNIIGALAALGLYIAGKRPMRHGGCWCYIVGRGWGGVSLGLVMIVAETSNHDDTKNHELGHALQNAVFGVFMPFVVAIPSAVRYWYRRGQDPLSLPPYNSIWFERQATEWGEKYIKEFRKQ
jgi:hypothetical protein